MSKDESLFQGKLNRASKELIFVNDLWDLLNLKLDTQKGKQALKLEIKIVVQGFSMLLSPFVTLETQTRAILDLRTAIAADLKKASAPIYDAFKHATSAELHANIQLVLGLLRELHPRFYDLEHLHGIVESLNERARNVFVISNAAAAESKATIFDFKPRIS